MDKAPLTPIQMLTALAGIAAIIGAFMPWADVSLDGSILGIGSIKVDSAKGTDTNSGLITLLLGAAIIAAVAFTAFAGIPARIAGFAAAGLGVAIVIVGTLAWLDLKGLIDADGAELESLDFVDVKVGVGLIVTVIAGIVAAATGAFSAMRATAESPAAQL